LAQAILALDFGSVHPASCSAMAGGSALFIGDLPTGATAEQIQGIFAQYGTITDFKAIPPNAPGNNSCAIVQYASPDDAKWLVDNVNGNVPQGLTTPVVVKFKQDKGWGKGPPPVEIFSGAPAMGKGETSSNETVFIGDLPVDIDDAMLSGVFSKYGTVVSCKALPIKLGATKGAGIVQFASKDEAQWLVENVNGNIPEGLETPVVVKFKQQGAGKGGDKGGGSWESGGSDFSKGGSAWSQGGGDWGKSNSYGKAGSDRGKGGGSAAPYSNPKGDKGKGKGKKGGPATCDIKDVVKGFGKGDRVPVEQQLCIRGLPWNTTDLDLYKIFSIYGAIPSKGVKAMLDAEGNCTGLGFVDFYDGSAAQMAAMTLHNANLPDGTVLQVTQKRDNGKGNGKGGGKEGGSQESGS